MHIIQNLPTFKEFTDNYIEESNIIKPYIAPVRQGYEITQGDIANFLLNSRQGDNYAYDDLTMQIIINDENNEYDNLYEPYADPEAFIDLNYCLEYAESEY